MTSSAPDEIVTRAVVIGGSAGAIEALGEILPRLPRGFPAPVLVVIHLPRKHRSQLVDIFARSCEIPVCEAEDKLPIAPGTVYFAPPDYHLMVELDHTCALSADEPVHFSRPAIDVLFESAASVYREGLVGMVLSGASADGAAGLRRIIEMGGRGLVESPEHAAVPTMPEAALHAAPSARVLPSRDIAAALRNELGEHA
jgi:two-component system, chemotaxis family, protein-glutamate methylesterase/glutaminase